MVEMIIKPWHGSMPRSDRNAEWHSKWGEHISQLFMIPCHHLQIRYRTQQLCTELRAFCLLICIYIYIYTFKYTHIYIHIHTIYINIYIYCEWDFTHTGSRFQAAKWARPFPPTKHSVKNRDAPMAAATDSSGRPRPRIEWAPGSNL